MLAVHQFSEGNNAHMTIAGAQYFSGIIGAYLFEMSVSPNLQTVASLTLPGQFYHPHDPGGACAPPGGPAVTTMPPTRSQEVEP